MTGTSNGKNVLLVSIDSLTKHFLGFTDQNCDIDVDTPNLDRFSERSATFDTHYAGSLPCMPARREWLTGTQEFLWRPWGPTEPFDELVPKKATEAGILSKLVTDHFHYFEHGSNGYVEDFHAFDFVRGHELDGWKTTPHAPDERLLRQTGVTDVDELGGLPRVKYARNVQEFHELDERDFFAPKVFGSAAKWMHENREKDQWFCYVDSFDVHEPFHCPEPYASMYTDEDPTDPDLVNWPYYGRVDEGDAQLTDRQLDFVRAQFAGKLTMVDRWFGRLLDALDRTDAWEDTMVVVTSDHGHFLGEHGWIGKPGGSPMYNVLAHTPLVIWDPDSSRMGETVQALTSAVDVYATLLDGLGIDDFDARHSRSLHPLLQGKTDSHRDWAIYGYWGSSVNVTDGQYTYLRPCAADADVGCYSTTMMNPSQWFSTPEPKADAEPDSVPYADAPVWRFDRPSHRRHDDPMLFDVTEDYHQEAPLSAPDTEERMISLLERALDELEAPDRQYERLGLA